MTPQKAIMFTKETLIPVGLVLVILGGVWQAAQVVQRVNINETTIKLIENKLDAFATKEDLENFKGDMEADIAEIKTDLKSLINVFQSL